MASVTAPTDVSSAAGRTNTGASGAGTSARRNYSRILEQAWIWSVVGYSVLRFGIAWGAFSEHGANVWLFGLIDVGTAWPYAKSVALVCKRAANSDWKRLPLPLVLAITTFFAPYAYIWFGAGEMPGGIRVGLAICVSVLLVAATSGVLMKTRKLRQAARAEMVETAEAAPVILDLRTERVRVIDLTTDTVSPNRRTR